MTIGPEPIKSIDAMSVRFGMQSSKSSTGPRHDRTNRRLIGCWLGRSAWAPAGCLIHRQDFRQPCFNLIDTSHIGGMGREKLWDGLLGSETEFIDHLARAPAHPFPERDGFTRIIPRLRHEPKPDIVGFRLLLPIERQGHVHSICGKNALNRPSSRMP